MPKQIKKPRYSDADIDKILHNNELLVGKCEQLTGQNESPQSQLTWLKRQVFGNKSEQLQYLDIPGQAELPLGSKPDTQAPVEEQSIKSYQRRQKKAKAGTPEDSGIRFDENEVEVKVIEVPCPELTGDQAGEYQVIGTHVDYRLAQRRSAYVMLKYIRKVIKHRDNQQIKNTPAPAGVFERNQWDVSFIAGLLVEKFLYHQPLYRQHQRLCRSGIELSRGTLTNITHRAIAQLEPRIASSNNHTNSKSVASL
jgi:transposase